MQRHPDGSVTLTVPEQKVTGLYVKIVAEENMGIEAAAGHALCALPKRDPEFVLWLSGGTLVQIGRTIYSVASL